MYKMQRLEVSGAVRPLYGSLGVKGLTVHRITAVVRIEMDPEEIECRGMECIQIWRTLGD